MSVGLAPVLLAAFVVLTVTLASHAEAYVYWANSWHAGYDPGTIGRANPDGSGVKQGFLHLPGGTCGLTVDETHIYWPQFVEIARASIDGTGAINHIADLYDPCGVAVDDTHIYWGNLGGFGPSEDPEDLAIGRANLDGTGVTERFIAARGSTCGVAVNATHIYWSYSPGTIGRANLDGTGVARSFITFNGSAQQTCGGLALDDEHVYWTNNPTSALSPGTIGRANLDGTDVEQSFITGVENPCGVAADSAHLYWANLGPDVPDVSGEARGTIGRANLDGTGVEQRFITGAERPCGVAVDARPGFGKLRRNRKRGTARLTVIVPGRGKLRLAKTTKVKQVSERLNREGKVKLPIKPRRKAKNQLVATGRVKVKAKVTFTPHGGKPNTQTKRLRLIKRR